MPTAGRQHLLIFPFNGNGREALDCLGAEYQLDAFIDDTPEKQGTCRFGHKIFGREAFGKFPDARVLAVPGGPASYLQRADIIGGLDIGKERFASVVHPAAHISRGAQIGFNVLIMAGVVITSNAVIGNHVCILPNSVIHHDASVGDWTLIGAAVTVAGGTAIGRNCYVGSGSSIMNDLTVGDRTLVGLGSNVIRSVPSDAKVAGNPARQIPARPRILRDR
jgi:sugar O-acyltransferase (sialic acid O-acetyltransferase NeuD family)